MGVDRWGTGLFHAPPPPPSLPPLQNTKFLHCVDIFCSQVHTSYVTQKHTVEIHARDQEKYVIIMFFVIVISVIVKQFINLIQI